MIAKGLTPIFNVSNIEEAFAWFAKLGWDVFRIGKGLVA